MSTRAQDEFREIKQILRSISKNQRNSVRFEHDLDWIDQQQLCSLLNMSSRTLHRIRKNYNLTTSKIGQKLYYLKSEVDALLRNHITSH